MNQPSQRYDCVDCEYSVPKNEAPESASVVLECPDCGSDLRIELDREA